MTPVTPPAEGSPPSSGSPAPAAPGPPGGTTRPVRRRTVGDDIEQALLDGAARLLTEEGPEALSVRRVAAEAGVSAMGVYSRFGGKQGLVEALYLDGFARLQHALASAPVTDDVVADLREGCRRYRQFALGSPAAYAVMFSRAVPDFVPSPPCKQDALTGLGVVIEVVGRAMEGGALRAGDPREVAEGIWATCHGLVSLELAGMGGVADREAHYDATVDALLRGLQPAC